MGSTSTISQPLPRVRPRVEKATTVYRAEQMFYEWPGSAHLVSANARKTQPAKLLAIIIAKKDSPQVMPV